MLLVGAGRVAQRRLESALADHELSLRLVGALGHLSHSPELSYSDLARRAGVTPQSMHATIASLLERGAITTGPSSRGQRAQLTLTEHGHALLDTAAAIAHRLDQDLDLGDLDPARLRAALLSIAGPGTTRS